MAKNKPCNYLIYGSNRHVDELVLLATFGAINKVHYARGGWVREGVTVCDRGGVQEHVTSRF